MSFTSELTISQRIALAKRLGIDDPADMTSDRLVEEIARLTDRVGAREFADPSGVLGSDRTVTVTAPRPRTKADPVETALDVAVGRGAIAMDDRETWRRRFAEQPDMTREILDGLPGNDALAERALEEDARTRSLGDQFDDYMGVPKEDRVERDYAEEALTEEERLAAWLAEATGEDRFSR